MFKHLYKEYYKSSSSRTVFFALAMLVVGFLSGVIGGFVASGINSDFFSWVGDSVKSGVIKEYKKEVISSLIEEEGETVRAVYNTIASTVNIVISKDISQATGQGFYPYGLFSETDEGSAPKKTEVGGGSGMIISSDGLVLTNKHVVYDMNADYAVILSDNRRFAAEVLARDPILDLAILKIKAANLPVVSLGDSDKVVLGQTVVAIGYSLSEYKNTVTKGIVSGIKRRVSAEGETIDEAIQTDAAINPGNSGGPLINLKGEVIGINTAINRQGQLIGFAIPINTAKGVIDSIKKYNRIVRPWLGVRYILLNDQLSEMNKLPVNYGAILLRGETAAELAVIPGSPADKAGFKEGDIILYADGEKITEDLSLSKIIGKRKVGDILETKVLRQGREIMVRVTLEEFGKK